MYKIFIDSSDNSLIIKLSKEIEKSLLSNDNCIVYMNNSNNSRYSVQNLDLDAYIFLQGEVENGGPEIILEEMSKVSNGLGKEIYKEIRKVYHDENQDKGVIYKEKVFEEDFGDTPAVLVNIISIDNAKDVEWLSNNTEKIAVAISSGIMASFKLKPC